MFTTCPQSKDTQAAEFADRVAAAAGWSEEIGCHGMLIYTDNGLVDPWLVAQIVLQSTEALHPLVAVQPIYMHPYAAAKMVTTLAYTHGRRVDVNMVAGGFRNDLLSLDDDTEHDARYDRLVEYAQVMQGLLTSEGGFSFEGHYYRLKNARLKPALPAALRPAFLVSGSSSAGVAAARAIGATAVKYPQPAREEPIPAADDTLSTGIRVGILTRPQDEEAWEVARRRFPEDRRGQITHRLAIQISDSAWHGQLAAAHDGPDPSVAPYWLWPFQNYRTFCPYLVGGYKRVAAEIAAYIDGGFRTFILDIPESLEDLRHTREAFDLAFVGLAA